LKHEISFGPTVRRRRRVDKLIPQLKFNFAPRINDIKRNFTFLLYEVAQGNRVGHFEMVR